MGLRQALLKGFARQAGHPSGVMGRFAIRTMNRANASMYARVITALDIQPADRVLDIGFGGGVGLAAMAEKASNGQVAGLDQSDTVVAAGRRRFARMVASGRMDIQRGDVAALPYPVATFDKVCTVNSLYFWPDPNQAFREIFRVLKPGGLLAVATREAEVMRKASVYTYGFRIYDAAEISAMLTQAGFEAVRAEVADGSVITIGRRPA
jgi:arsenite methyltransferase